MTPQPERQAREVIDRLLASAGWQVGDDAEVNFRSARRAIGEFPFLATALPILFRADG